MGGGGKGGAKRSWGGGKGGDAKKARWGGGGGGGGANLSQGLQGIVFTIDPYKEGQAMKEIRSLMERYVVRVDEAAAENGDEDAGDSGLGGISMMLKAGLEKAKKAPEGIGSFVQTGCRGNLFYKIPDKVKYPSNTVVDRIAEGLVKSGLEETRFVYKMQPIAHTCAAHAEAITRELSREIKPVLEKAAAAATGLLRWSIVWNKKSNSDATLDRIKLADAIMPLMPAGRSVVDLKTPDTAFIVSIYKTVACLGVACEYQTHREYNIHKLTRRGVTGGGAGTAATDAAPAGDDDEKAAATAEDKPQPAEGTVAAAEPSEVEAAAPADNPAGEPAAATVVAEGEKAEPEAAADAAAAAATPAAAPATTPDADNDVGFSMFGP